MPTKHVKTWIVLTNTNNCKVYVYNCNTQPSQLHLIQTIDHPENRLRDIELTSDKPGHYIASDSAHGAYSQSTDPKEIRIDDFSRELAKMLEHNRTANAYDQLFIIAEAKMNGRLCKHLNDHVKQLIAKNIKKDLMNLSAHELLKFLQTDL